MTCSVPPYSNTESGGGVVNATCSVPPYSSTEGGGGVANADSVSDTEPGQADATTELISKHITLSFPHLSNTTTSHFTPCKILEFISAFTTAHQHSTTQQQIEQASFDEIGHTGHVP